MIVVMTGRWNSWSTRYFIFTRIWFKGYKWSPFCKV